MKKRFERLVVITLALSMVFTQPLALMAAESDYLGGNTSVEMRIETDELSLSENSEQVAEEDTHQMEVSQDDLTGNTISENTLSDEMISVSGELVNKEVSEEPAGEGNGNVAAICIRDRRSMAIDTYGNLWEWGGDNEYVDDPEYLQPRKNDDAKNDTVVEVSIGLFHRGDSVEMDTIAYVDTTGLLRHDAFNPKVLLKDNIDKLSLTEGGFYFYGGAIDKDGKLWGWPYVDLGRGMPHDSPDFDNPVNILPDTRFKELSFGKNHYAAIDTEGNLWIWGANNFGQLGNGSSSDYFTYIEPSKVKSGTKFKKVSLGADQSAAIDTEGNLWTWGNNKDGALGDGTRQDRYTPAKVMEGTLFKEVSLGNSHGVAVDVNGNLWTWGTNSYGELGNGSVDSFYTIHAPEKIMQDTHFTEVSLGDNHSAAIDTNGDLWVWGRNNMGQIGDGTKTDCPTPKIITIPDSSSTPKCTVSFNSMGGSEVPSQKLASGSYVTKPADPTRKGYQFGGWYKDSKCTQAWDFNSDKVTENPTILYAKWTKIRQMGNPVKNANSTTWDCIWFGHYYQDEDKPYMDKDPIKWRILNIDENGEALLLADKNLDDFLLSGQIGKTWKDSGVRNWLNSSGYNKFKRNAFTFIEQAAIIDSNVDGSIDKVFILDKDEINNPDYGFIDRRLDSYPDPQHPDCYAFDDGRKVAENTEYSEGKNDDNKSWFLRERDYIVGAFGTVWTGLDYENYYKVRPATRLNLKEHQDLWRDAGTVTVYVDDQNEYVKTDDTSGEKPAPASVKYQNWRWAFNNSSSDNKAEYAGFAGRKTRYMSEDDYYYLLGGLKGTSDYDERPDETEKHRFAKKYLAIAPFEDIGDYNNVRYRFKNWTGSCHGMSLLEGLYLSEEYKPNGCETLGNAGTIAYTDGPLESEINVYQVLQNTDISFSSRKPAAGKGEDFGKLIEKAKSIKSLKDSFIVRFYLQDEDGDIHHVLCYGGENCDIEEDGKTYKYRLKIYDPNYSIYDDDYSCVYITDDKKECCIPSYSCEYKSTDEECELYFYDTTLLKLSKFTKVPNPKRMVDSVMKKIIINNSASGKMATYNKGAKGMGSDLDVDFYGVAGYVVGENYEFPGGNYILETFDPDGIYSIEGGVNDKLDAAFEYGDHTVDVVADKTGVSAEFSNNGDVELKGLDATDFVINNVYNEDSTAKPGEATKVVISANGTGDVAYKKNAQGEFVLDDGDNGNSLKNVSIIIGTTLKSEKHDELPDAKGKITISFNGGEVVVKEDTNGDGDPDHVERFSDYVPVTMITVTPATASLAVGETLTLTASVEPANATSKKLFWFSDDPKVVTVSDGKITGVAAGTTVVRAVTGIGKAVGTCTVTVTGGGSDDPDDPDIPDDAPEGIWIKGLKKAYTYTGSAIKPEFRVYKGKTRLYEKTDYTVKFSNNKKPGTATVTLKMKGNYSGSKDVTFKIDRASLTTDVSADTIYAAYKKNKTQKPKPVLYVNGTKLKYGKNDLAFTYPSTASGNGTAYSDVGTWKIHIASKNTKLFTAEKDVDLVIVDKPVMSSVTIKPDKKSVPYDSGKPVSPRFTLKYGSQTLTEGKDYQVVYEDDHSDIGKHKVTFEGNNKDFFGKKSYTFSITGKYDLASQKAVVSINETFLNNDGSVPFAYGGAKPGMNVRFNGSRLRAGKDYSVTYTNHKALGTATATVKGKGKYKGSVPVRFRVGKCDINTISPNIPDKVYSNKDNAYKKISIIFVNRDHKNQKLKKNTDYTIKYEKDYGSVPVQGTEIMLTLEGKGNYTGTLKTSYRIIDKNFDLSKAKVVVNGSKAYDYTGKEIRPEITDLNVTLNGNTLNRDCYEILGYYNNVKKGKSAYIVLGGKGSYGGKKNVRFKIGASPVEKEWTGIILKLKQVFSM